MTIMSTAVQPSLLAFEPEGEGDSSGHATWSNFRDFEALERTDLSRGAWIEVQRGWLRNGFELFDDLVASPEWQTERRKMYDSVVDVPRLLRFFRTGHQVPWPMLVEARQLLSRHYQPVLGEDFTSTGLCLYRDGRDSVAWHGDTKGRGATVDTIVAILSLGASRTFALRPKSVQPKSGGGSSLRLTLDHGDLIVMGGSCQRTWEHALPKTARRIGPRVSVQFRPSGVS
jgi:alkylated DNA repair dioxygenase AlkB